MSLTRLHHAIVALIWMEPSWVGQRHRADLRRALEQINPIWGNHEIGAARRKVLGHYASGHLRGWERTRPRQNTEVLIKELGAYYRPSLVLTEGCQV